MPKILLLLLAAVCLPIAAQTPYLVKDLNTTYSNDTGSSTPGQFMAVGNRIFFIAISCGIPPK